MYDLDTDAYGKGDPYELVYSSEEDSAVTGNKRIEIAAKLSVPKEDRDYEMFGEYEVKFGCRVYANANSASWVSLGEFDTEYFLEEPDYEDFGENQTAEELFYQEIDFKNFEIDVKEDLGFDGRGEQRVYIELIASEMFYVDDKVRMYMDLELPESALTDGTIVYQYIQMLGSDETEGDSPYIGAGCQITVGEEDSQKVDNFLGMSKLSEQ